MVEIPKGSRNKYEWDEQLQAISSTASCSPPSSIRPTTGSSRDTWARTATRSTRWSAVSEPTFPGCVIPVKPIALFRMRDDKGVDDKVLCVPLAGPELEHDRVARRPAEQLRDEISHFFGDLQDARGQGRRGRRLVPARGGAARDRASRARAGASSSRRSTARARAGMRRGPARPAARGAAGAVPGPRTHRLSERRHERPAAARGDRRRAGAAGARAGGGPGRHAPLRAPRAAGRGAARRLRGARRLHARRPRADDLHDGGDRARAARARPAPRRRDRHERRGAPRRARPARGAAGARGGRAGSRRGRSRRRGRPAHAASSSARTSAGAAGVRAGGAGAVDVPVLLDGAQGAGAVPVDVAALGCDAYAAAGQKWLCGPEGTGLLYVSAALRERMRPPAPGYVNLASRALGSTRAVGGRARVRHARAAGRLARAGAARARCARRGELGGRARARGRLAAPRPTRCASRPRRAGARPHDARHLARARRGRRRRAARRGRRRRPLAPRRGPPARLLRRLEQRRRPRPPARRAAALSWQIASVGPALPAGYAPPAMVSSDGCFHSRRSIPHMPRIPRGCGMLRAGAGATPARSLRRRYLVSRSMTNMASISAMAKHRVLGMSPPLLYGPPVGPVPPAPGEEDSPPSQPDSPSVTKLARFATIQRNCKFSAQRVPNYTRNRPSPHLASRASTKRPGAAGTAPRPRTGGESSHATPAYFVPHALRAFGHLRRRGARAARLPRHLPGGARLRAKLHRNYVGALERGEINPTFRRSARSPRGSTSSCPR